MGIRKYNPYTPSRRNMTGYDFQEITKTVPEKSLTVTLKKNSGRNNQGKITVRHQGGGYRTKYRIIDFKRIKTESLQQLRQSSTILTEQQISLSSAMQTEQSPTSLLLQDLRLEIRL